MKSTTTRFRRRNNIAPLVLVATILFMGAVAVRAEFPVVKEAPQTCTGALSQEQGVSVLRLWGSPREQGHAQGKLFGRQIVEVMRMLFDGPMLFNDPQQYEGGVRQGLLKTFELTNAEQSEITGMLAGIRETVGDDGMTFKRLGREMDETDLIALNTLADWIPGGCSSFAAWGKMTADGGTVVGRNLDYFDLPGLKELHLIIVRQAAGEDASGWVSIAWPGLIGAYTAMNEHGVVVAMHDVDVPPTQPTSRRRPRSLVLRQIIETTDASNAIQVAEKILLSSTAARGNNFLVATAASKGNKPAVVFEYDGHTGESSGVTIRYPANVSEKTPEFIACTNHYRARAKSDDSCQRYKGISEKLGAPNDKIDSDAAWSIMKGAAVKGTIHSMVAFPNSAKLELRFATPEDHACNQPPKQFSIDKLLER